MQRTQFPSLAGEDSICHRATKPVHHSYGASALEPGDHKRGPAVRSPHTAVKSSTSSKPERSGRDPAQPNIYIHMHSERSGRDPAQPNIYIHMHSERSGRDPAQPKTCTSIHREISSHF